MSRPVTLPSTAEVRTAITDLSVAGPATVTALAHRLGLTNPTFWRHFPDEAREVAALARGHRLDPGRNGEPAAADRLAHLVRTNRQLTDDLQVATTNIARLTLDNHQLRTDLEAAAGLGRLTPRGRP